MSRRALAAGVALASLLSVGGVAAQDASPEPPSIPVIVAGTTVTGTIDAPSERDAFALTIDPTEPASLLDVRLIAPTGPARRVCVEQPPDPPSTALPIQLACARGEGGAVLRDLLLAPGAYQVMVDGDPGPDIYALVLDRTSAPLADHETEPNDVPTLATPWDASMVLQAWHEDGDRDHYALRTTGEPQRWRLEVAGEGIVGFQQVRMTGGQLAAAAAAPDTERTTWVFPDVYLGPGDHLLQVDGSGVGAYTLTATPLGPPDPDGELEPNDVDPEPLPVGTTRSGMLASTSDQDQYRFSLTAEERIRIRVEPPADGGAYFALGSSTESVATAASEGPGAPAELDLVLPPDDYVLRMDATHPSDQRYRISLTRQDPFADESVAELPVEVALRTGGSDVAAFWPRGQAVPATLTITNTGTAPLDLALDARTSDLRWAVDLGPGAVSVAPGATETVPISIEVPADASRVPVRATIRARDASGAQQTAFVEVTPARDASPVGERLAWSVPGALLGGIDVAAIGQGASPLVSIHEEGELALHDGVAPIHGGMDTLVTLPVTLTVDLAGDASLPIAGMLLNPVATQGGMTGVPRDVELLLSEDGTTWLSALTGVLSPAPFEQSFVLPAPVGARFAQLRITSTWGQPGTLQFGEWKVVATPGVMPTTGPVDLADPAVGGHIAWMDPQPSSQQLLDDTLHGDPARLLNWLALERGTTQRVSWVVSFKDDRAARVASLGWEDADASRSADRLRSVQVAISEVGPDGPWQALGTWRLKRARDGSVAPFELGGEPWVRAVRFGGAIPRGASSIVELPTRMHAFERPPDDAYRSITGEWGDGVAEGPQEWVAGAETTATESPPDLGNHTVESAIALDRGEVARGRVQRDVVEDWYSVTVPEGHRTLRFQLGGEPFVGAAVELRAPDGTLVPLAGEPGAIGRGLELSASVEPGLTYRARVHQPRVSAIISLDTSASIDLTPVTQALDAYARDVVEGEEFFQLLPFESEPLLDTWSDDRWEVADGLRRLIPSGSSAVEAALIDTAKLLATREGNRAVLLLTDAMTSSFRDRTEAWEALHAVRPVIFPVHVSGPFDPDLNRQVMQDLAGLGGGRYVYAPSRSTLDIAFDRMATWLRRPATYGLSWTSSADELAPPEPGSLSVRAQPGADGSPGAAPIDPDTAIEIVLDTSGSMLAKLGRTTRIAAAKDVLTRLVREDLPAGVPVALRWFRQAPKSCDTELAVPLGPLDPEAMATIIEGIRLDKTVKTPLAAAIDAVADDLAGVTGPKVVVVVSDGRESCKGDPEAAVRRLREQGIDVTVNVVGLGLNAADRKRIRRLAGLGGGAYYDAQGAGALDDALRTAVSAPYEVFDQAGELVARGTVNGPAVKLPAGLYRVVVLTEPEQVFEDVLVEEGESPTLELSGT